MMERKWMTAMMLVLAMGLTACSSVTTKEDTTTAAATEAATAFATDTATGYQGIDGESPDFVGTLDVAKDAEQIMIVAAYDQESTTAWISLHEKQDDGTWHMTMSTPGYIGRKGLGKTKRGDLKTPQGVYHFTQAFGIADDPGSIMPYVKVDNDHYWSGDSREGYHYNELISLKDLPDYDTGTGEHLIDYLYQYQYCLNISYNTEGIPDAGNSIFLHCFGPIRPYTGGCVAIPEDYMKFVLQHVDENTVLLIDTYETITGTDEWLSSTWLNVK